MGGHKVAPNPALVDSYPDVYLTTGLVAENHAREAQRLARGAGRVRAAQPPARGRGDRRRPVRRRDRRRAGRRRHGGTVRSPATKGRGATRRSRRSAKLRPAFHVKGTVTAGNSSQTSDGAAAVVVMDARPRARARARAARAGSSPSRPPASSRSASASARCPPIRKVLKLAGLTLEQIDLVELNEAFAAQVSPACASCRSIPSG